jgi:hypothetical protein
MGHGVAVVALLMNGLVISCSDQSNNREPEMSVDNQLKQDLETVGKMRVYFCHMSVGRNILQGLKDVSENAQSAALRFVNPSEAKAITSGFFAESDVGNNGKPNLKCDTFRSVLKRDAFGDSLDIAILKFCFVDVSAETNPEEVFSYYKQTVETLQKEYPGVFFLHMTVPLTTRTAGWRRVVKSLIRRDDPSGQESYNRLIYNNLLLREYDDKSVFDLAAIESTGSDGTRIGYDHQGKLVYGLLDDYTDDGGHLNKTGRFLVAQQLVRKLASLGEHHHAQ